MQDAASDELVTSHLDDIAKVLEQFVEEGLAEKAEAGMSVYETPIRLTDQGIYEKSFSSDDGDEPPLVVSVPSPDDAISGSTASEPTLTYHPPPADSTRWTGSTLQYVDSSVLADIRRAAAEIRQLAYRINYQSDEDASDLRGLADALVALCDMAVPDVSVIARILAHPKFRTYTALFAAAATIRGALGI